MISFLQKFVLTLLFFTSCALWNMNHMQKLPMELWQLCVGQNLESPRLKIDFKPAALYIITCKLVCQNWNKWMIQYCKEHQNRLKSHFCGEGRWASAEFATVKAFGVSPLYIELGQAAIEYINNCKPIRQQRWSTDIGFEEVKPSTDRLDELVKLGLDINYSIYEPFGGVQTLLYKSFQQSTLVEWFLQQKNMQPNGTRAIYSYAHIINGPTTDWYSLYNSACRCALSDRQDDAKLYRRFAKTLQKKGAFIHIKNKGVPGWRLAQFNLITQRLEFVDGLTKDKAYLSDMCSVEELSKDYFASIYDGQTYKLLHDPSIFKYQCDVNERDFYRNTLLHLVCKDKVNDIESKKNLKRITEQLLHAKANPNLQNVWGDTPLHCAVEATRTRQVEVLIKARACVNIKNSANKTAIDIAKENGNRVILAIISYQQTLQNQQKCISNTNFTADPSRDSL